MISLERCRSLCPELADQPDEVILKIREEVYQLGKIALADFLEKKGGSNNSSLVIFPPTDS